MVTQVTRIFTATALAAMLVTLSGCMGSQTGKGLNAFDSKSFWESDYSEPLHSNSFWYSGYSDDDVKKAEKPSGSGKDIWGNKTGGASGD